MKKLTAVLLATTCLLLSTSCAADYPTDLSLRETVAGRHLYYGDFSEIETRRDIVPYIRARVSYKSESVDEATDPEHTLSRGYGDCEDFAILYMNILYVVFQEESSIACVDIDKRRAVVEGGSVNHAIVQLQDGQLIEPQSGYVVDCPVGYRFSFWTVFRQD